MGIVEDTPFKKTILRIRAHRGGHHKALPDAEVSRIKREIPALRDERQRLYMALLVYTGMRREEVLGLGWENIHLEEGYGEVKRVVVYPNNGRAVVREGAKTEASERTFLIPDALREILLPHRREHGYLIHGKQRIARLPIPPCKEPITPRLRRWAFTANSTTTTGGPPSAPN